MFYGVRVCFFLLNQMVEVANNNLAIGKSTLLSRKRKASPIGQGLYTETGEKGCVLHKTCYKGVTSVTLHFYDVRVCFYNSNKWFIEVYIDVTTALNNHLVTSSEKP
jgi:hypothetical protein